jgi:hypothetical protein
MAGDDAQRCENPRQSESGGEVEACACKSMLDNVHTRIRVNTREHAMGIRSPHSRSDEIDAITRYNSALAGELSVLYERFRIRSTREKNPNPGVVMMYVSFGLGLRSMS